MYNRYMNGKKAHERGKARMSGVSRKATALSQTTHRDCTFRTAMIQEKHIFMKTLSFHELYTLDFTLSDLFGQKQKWIKGALFRMDHPRHASGLIYLNGCHGKYTNKRGEMIDAPAKSLVYLPYGSEYTVLNFDCGNGVPDAWLVEFNILCDGEKAALSDSPFVIGNVNTYLAYEMIRGTVETYEASVQSPAAVKAHVYRLLSFLGKESLNAYNRRFQSIAPGIQLLEDDTADTMPIKEIAAACGVSCGCFNKLFRRYSGQSPLQYRIELKLGKAKNMLRDSNIPVCDISESLGFTNSAYFCRLFKKKTGMTPSEYRETRY